jgi:hypothetical protein
MAWQIVTPADIVSRWRPLTPEEANIIASVIADAQDILEVAAEDAGIPEVTAGDGRRVRAYVRLVATMVIRVLRNPDGFLTETIDDYTYRRDSAVSAGALYLSDDELGQLRPVGGPRRRSSFTIVLS